MSNEVHQDRYSQSTIRTFVSSQQNIAESAPLIEQQVQQEEIFADASNQPSGPIDLLYRFTNDLQKPALGFQQVDSEQDEEPMYSLVYIDPGLSAAWQSHIA
ncbi:hypothetical protein [Dictyobacter aurantiacus]|uniref:Uncharacterized protein n=1 Tax=Dictyobacter aurantiacus TaxID=1936993 RepID=A0A401ZKA0_9CHLR|nr:hypothetical protein [Dictyobacter aurantiacus]GCE07297.1 hypothetical protein KDAU_46260 [Dictyobacter aurantiacus]